MKDSKREVGVGSYIVAGLSFIPLLGVLFAIISIITGIAKRKNGGVPLIVLGVLGITLTVGSYSLLFYEGFVVRGGVYDKLRDQLARVTITELAKNIEYYKLVKGQYPASLLDIQPSLNQGALVSIYDPTLQLKSFNVRQVQLPLFFYQLAPDKAHYYLLGVGADGKPFTDDDILPNLSAEERAKTGLLINPASLPMRK